jgi:hypothetical protein
MPKSMSPTFFSYRISHYLPICPRRCLISRPRLNDVILLLLDRWVDRQWILTAADMPRFAHNAEIHSQLQAITSAELAAHLEGCWEGCESRC